MHRSEQLGPPSTSTQPSAASASSALAAGPAELTVATFTVGGEEFAWLSFSRAEVEIPELLSEAEREIARAILAGHSNREIAAQRRVAKSTIANQMQAIFRKLSVGSRWELVRFCCLAVE